MTGFCNFCPHWGHINPTGDDVQHNTPRSPQKKSDRYSPPLTYSMIHFLKLPLEGCFKGQNLGKIAFTVHHAEKDPGVLVPLF